MRGRPRRKPRGYLDDARGRLGPGPRPRPVGESGASAPRSVRGRLLSAGATAGWSRAREGSRPAVRCDLSRRRRNSGGSGGPVLGIRRRSDREMARSPVYRPARGWYRLEFEVGRGYPGRRKGRVERSAPSAFPEILELESPWHDLQSHDRVLRFLPAAELRPDLGPTWRGRRGVDHLLGNGTRAEIC